jgi:hypothetical protein
MYRNGGALRAIRFRIGQPRGGNRTDARTDGGHGIYARTDDIELRLVIARTDGNNARTDDIYNSQNTRADGLYLQPARRLFAESRSVFFAETPRPRCRCSETAAMFTSRFVARRGAGRGGSAARDTDPCIFDVSARPVARRLIPRFKCRRVTLPRAKCAWWRRGTPHPLTRGSV